MSRGRFPMRGWSAASPLVCDYRGFVPCHASAPAIAGAPPTSSLPQAENRSMTTYRAHSRQWVLRPINTSGACNHYKSGLPRYFRSPRRQQYVGWGGRVSNPPSPSNAIPFSQMSFRTQRPPHPFFPRRACPREHGSRNPPVPLPCPRACGDPCGTSPVTLWVLSRVLACGDPSPPLPSAPVGATLVVARPRPHPPKCHAGTHPPPLPSAPVGATLVVARPRPQPNVIPNATKRPPHPLFPRRACPREHGSRNPSPSSPSRCPREPCGDPSPSPPFCPRRGDPCGRPSPPTAKCHSERNEAPTPPVIPAKSLP